MNVVMNKKRNWLVGTILMIVAAYLMIIPSSTVFAAGDGSDTGGVCTSNCGDPDWWGFIPIKVILVKVG